MILLLEDDVFLMEIMEEFLVSRGFEVECVNDADEALEKALNQQYELFIFDVKVPLGDGFSLLRHLREHKIQTPTIFTTSLNAIGDLQEGYESGCDDYLKKPFELEELFLRIQKLLKKENSYWIEFGGGVYFDCVQKLLYRDQELLPLTNKENELLAYLIENRGKYLTLEDISYRLWGYEEPSFLSLRVYIKNLRIYIGKDRIKTKRGYGYCYE
ncbi:response regulator transcription factor [Helicobacter kayseriensis]|uniref:response regulator transcription factor n=1 Tax=Helicobacter kayseriensis TaxID=2905877 RepID=UPI001E5AF962|nr:response regulator transcription factor [Helicobacter kayseriensis]MCE3047622.1 response regulator transcription factor [Helicobacter kayseriensis]MCE3049026.1 response regulator transcription factor [Helicobacter kayseriensis]